MEDFNGSNTCEDNTFKSETTEENVLPSDFYAVKVTGVQRDSTDNDVRQFFDECTLQEVVFGGNGVIFIRMDNPMDFEKACKKDGHQLRWQKVGVFSVLKEEFDEAKGIVTNESVVTLQDKDDDHNSTTEEDNQYNVIRLRGLPYSATAADVMDFLRDVTIDKGEKGIHFSSGSYGRSTGEVFVEVCSPEDVNNAMKQDREHMGGRYIEIFRASRAQLEWECRGEKTGGTGGVVRLRGLPYGCSQDDLRDFLKGINIIENGITIQYDENGRETGEAFVEVETDRDVEKALDRHRKSIGHRYIEVFRTTHGDIRPVANRWASHSRPAPYSVRGRGYDGPGGYNRGRGAGYRYGGRGGSQRGGRGGGSGGYGNSYGGSGGYGYYNDNAYGRGDGNLVAYPTLRPSDSNTKYTGSRPRHAVRMRGLPFSVTERDIQDFFSPLIPIHISIESDSSGRLSGEGEISFGSHEDAEAAMKKDRGHIGSRYIELFLHSKPIGDVRSQRYFGQPEQQQHIPSDTWSNDSYVYSSSQSMAPDPRAQTPNQPPQQQQQYAQYPQQYTQYPTNTQQSYGNMPGQAYSAQYNPTVQQQTSGVCPQQTYGTQQQTAQWF